MPKISDAEWTIMKVLWKKQKITANELVDILKEKISWNHRTIKTLLNRLLKKKIIKFTKKGRVYHYFPIAKESECIIEECQSFLKKVFDGALSPMIAALISEQKLSADEIEELRDLLNTKGVTKNN